MIHHYAQDNLLDAAEALVLRHRQASKSLLQRHLQIGYATALMLMEGLEQRGVVTPPNPHGHRILARLESSLSRHSGTERTARSLCDLALTFFECREEGFEPHSMATALCLDVPALKLSHTAAKNVARKVLAGKAQTPVTDLAVALGRATKLGQTEDWAAVEMQVRNVGAGLDRPFVPVTCDSEKVARAYWRALRYLDRRLRDGEDPHSRVWDAFVPMAYVPQGRQRGESVATHPEHVVPCKSLAMEASRLLRAELDFNAVQRWIQPYLVVVWIEKGQAGRFDMGGDLKHLKHSMPQDWKFGGGCRYERLHLAGIEFDAPPQFGCECSAD